ncbi:hypothetical protein SIM88_01640 [Cupriavidus necator]|nr:hypothetical protein [Cupriavidus necator]MDX6007464.1 hypothetical protein [Cupriavidus necator]
MTKKSKKSSAPKLFPDDLIDQLLAQVQNKVPSRFSVNQAWPACSRSSWPSVCAGCLCRQRLGPQIPDGGRHVAAAMGAGHPVLRLSAGSAQNHLHH